PAAAAGPAAAEVPAAAGGGAAAEAPAAAAAGAGEPTDGELAEHRAVDAARAADLQAHAGLALIYERVMPAVIQGQRVQQSVEQRVESIRTRVPQVVQEELSMGVQDLTSLVQEALPQASALRSEALPSVSLIVAGLFAPLQLQGLYASHAGRLGLCGALLGVDVIGLLVDGGKRCLTEDVFGPMNILHYWVAGDAALLAVTVATSLMAILRCNKTFAEMKVATDAPVNLPADPEAAFRVMMEGHLLNGARAMMEYDRLVQSVPFQMVYAVNVVDFFWQVAGWLLFFDTPGAECEAKFLLYWSRGRGMIFLIGFVPALVGLVMTLAKAATETRSFRAAVLQERGGAAAARGAP
ncbi:unnamed protein product, partial [Prorocentrum cordatum]